eukprot:973026-Prymnesium_polylepis.1
MKLMPHASAALAEAGMLSLDGRCKTFDTRANGMVRTEATGSQAVEPFESSLSMVRMLGSTVQQDGRSASITAPNGAAQQKLLKLALAAASTTIDKVDVVEVHGTGTKL